MKCFIRSESCAELARLWGVMMMTMMRLNIMCSDYNDMDMDVRWCCAELRCNVSCDMMWCAVCGVGWCTIFAIYLWISINIISRARMSESAVFFLLLLSLACYQALHFQTLLPWQIQICDATQCSSIYTLWAHNCVCVCACILGDSFNLLSWLGRMYGFLVFLSLISFLSFSLSLVLSSFHFILLCWEW